MTPLLKFARSALEKAFGTFYEGTEPPARLFEPITAFRKHYPKATSDEWEVFAKKLVEAAYRDGWVRGHEYGERDPDRYTELPPELEEAEREAAGTPPVLPDLSPADPLEEVEPEPLEPEKPKPAENIHEAIARMQQNIERNERHRRRR